jgi:diamine N-acetyltransferase
LGLMGGCRKMAVKSKPIQVCLAGPRVILRPVRSDDANLIRKWFSDPEIMGLIGEVKPMSQAAAVRYVRRVRVLQDRLWFMIELSESGRTIGEAGLLRMFRPWHTTDLTMIIGEKDAWGRGYGTEAIMLLLEHAFGQLGFHRVSVGVVGFNRRALRFYRNAGFKKEGVQRDGYLHKGRYSDFVMMSILADEFRPTGRRSR